MTAALATSTQVIGLAVIATAGLTLLLGLGLAKMAGRDHPEPDVHTTIAAAEDAWERHVTQAIALAGVDEREFAATLRNMPLTKSTAVVAGWLLADDEWARLEEGS